MTNIKSFTFYSYCNEAARVYKACDYIWKYISVFTSGDIPVRIVAQQKVKIQVKQKQLEKFGISLSNGPTERGRERERVFYI